MKQRVVVIRGLSKRETDAAVSAFIALLSAPPIEQARLGIEGKTSNVLRGVLSRLEGDGLGRAFRVAEPPASER